MTELEFSYAKSDREFFLAGVKYTSWWVLPRSLKTLSVALYHVSILSFPQFRMHLQEDHSLTKDSREVPERYLVL